jgi:hypothetical protein
MFAKLSTVGVMLCALSYASAGTPPIGTASARGDMRVDGYMVKGDATLFDGTVVETGQASAVLRLDKGVEIKLSTGSRGILHRDRLVLQRGASEWTPSSSFLLEANGLRVTPKAPNSRGLVSMSGANTVELAALTGEFRVMNDQGLLLGSVRPGNELSFGTPQAGEQGAVALTLFGNLTRVDGHYFLALPTPDAGVIYEVRGVDLDSFVGQSVTITGKVDRNMRAMSPASYEHVIVVSSIRKNAVATNHHKALIGAIVGASAGAGAGIYEAVQSQTSASR